MKIDNLEQLFLHGLKYVYDAEQQLTEALPKLVQASSSPELRQAFEQHLQETKEHVARAQQIFKQCGQQPESNPNAILKQMSQEVEQMIQNTDEGPVRDAALIVAGNQAEHYEMAAYGSLKNFAELLGKQEAVQILQKTLDEEKKADALLTKIGESSVNQQALHKSAAATAR